MKLKINKIEHTFLKGQYFKTCLFILVFISNYNVFAQTTYNINDPEDLTALSTTLAAGDTVILADGTYTSDNRIKFSPTTGTSDLPITFRSQTPGGVKFTGGLKMSIGGDYVVVDGFHWQGGMGASNFIEFRDSYDYANYSTIQNCAIDALTASDPSVKHRWIVLYGTYNTVINCSFMNKSNAGALVLVELEYNASPDDGITNTRCNTVGHTISNNYFYKYAKIDPMLTNAGDSETIRVGTSEYQNVDSGTIVSNNYFVEADGENEIITNKSKNNSYTNNTFRRCRGSLVLRHGSNATVDGNYFLGAAADGISPDVDGTGGIRITDSNHTITNNYIQDCITILNQAKWNNGITFIGGTDSAAVSCNSTSVSNGYQKSENITIYNNTIINTNAPLFYNTDKGSTDPTGIVSNNLIYFAAADPNISDVISGDTPTSYANLGTALTYTGNVYTGAPLGVTNAGFSEEIGITATADGEIFTFSGAGSTGKGANMGTYVPTTDDMVGYGIGACFLDYSGTNIIDGDCTIVIPESLIVSSLPWLPADVASYNVTVNANVNWTALSNDPAWITIDTFSGTGNATVLVSVTENTDTSSRVGTVTFTQDAGGNDIVRTLTVTQDGADLTTLYNLINNVAGGGPVSIHSFSKEEANGVDKFNYAANTLDKDNNTRWAADDGSIVSGDYKGNGEYVIFDLGNTFKLDLIQIATDDKSDPYGLQIWVSTNGTDPSNFTMILPSTGNLLITTTTGTSDDFDQYEITANARYVKLVGFGRFTSAGDSRKSVWTNITEIEFYGELSTLSIDDKTFTNQLLTYPNPVTDFLTIKSTSGPINSVKIYSLQGRKVLEQFANASINEISLNLSSLSIGAYILNIYSNKALPISKMIIISR